MIYTVVEKETGKRYGLDAKDIDAVRRHIYWKEGFGIWDIYKNKRLLGTMYKGNYYWGYDPNTGYTHSYTVNGGGYLMNDDWEVE